MAPLTSRNLDATTPLVPKKLFVAQDTPNSVTPVDAQHLGASLGRQDYTSARRTTPPSRSPSVPAQQPAVRYGLYRDPDEYYTRFVNTGNGRRYGLMELSDEDSDEEGEEPALFSLGALSVGSRRQGSVPIAELSPVEDMIKKLQLQWQNVAEQQSAERSARLQSAFREADKELAGHLDRIDQDIRRKQREQQQADELQAQQQLQARTTKLKELQRSHEKAAAAQQEQVERLQRAAQAEEEARRKRQEEEERAAAQRREQEQQQRERQEQEAREHAAREAHDKAREEAARQAAEEAKKAEAAAAAVAGVKPGTKIAAAARHCIRCAEPAKAFELEVAQRAKQIIDSLQGMMADDSLKKQRRDIEKKMTVHVQQISAVVDQVNRKCVEVYRLIASQPTELWRHYSMLMFATKVIKQADLVQLNNRAAFPLAMVVVKISTEFRDLMDLMLHMLHRECCFSVPCTFVRADPTSNTELTAIQQRRLLGYKEIDDPEKPDGKMLESDDTFIQRVEGIMYLYGAMVQVEDARSPHNLDDAWRWLARFLNAIPASRAAGKALIFFLRAAGWSMYRRFRTQFIKVLKCMHDEFLPELAQCNEHDIQAVRTMLQHYLMQGVYRQEPEGRSMPNMDASSMTRA